MPALMAIPANSAGRKRKAGSEDADEIVEGVAADWKAAKLRKRPKKESSRPRTDQATNYQSTGSHARRTGEQYPSSADDGLGVVPPPPGLETIPERKRWLADPTKLGSGKKAKYYGVLQGRKPGIYYSWDDTEAQVRGFGGAVHMSSTKRDEIERFMNHSASPPCAFVACGGKCESSKAKNLAPLNSIPTFSPAEPIPRLNSESSPPASFSTSILTKSVCNCDKAENANEPTVDCANPDCSTGAYHKKCVGLVNRLQTAGWRCLHCRVPLSSKPTSIPAYSPSQGTQVTPNDRTGRSLQQNGASDINPLLSAEPEPPLHPEQERVVNCILNGHNVFYTGSAGVGKSTVLKNFVRRLENTGKKVDIIAPSGIAALNVGGMTTYSYAGWTPDSFKQPLHKLIGSAYGKKVRRRLCKTDVLVIDEISMVERDVFVRLDHMMREARDGWRDLDQPRGRPTSVHNKNSPFGGVQLIVTGDFCQLPPVRPYHYCLFCGGGQLPNHDKQDGRPLTCPRCARVYRDEDKWAFRCENWDNCGFSYFELKHIHRQSDADFIKILQKCRHGEELLPAEKTLLTKGKPDPVGAVKILPTRREVEQENSSKFNMLPGTPRAYECCDVFSWRNRDEPELQKYGRPRYPDRPNGPLQALKDHRFEETIELKVGMLVILLYNLSFPEGLVNGSQGKIIRFEPYDSDKPVVPRPRESSPARGAKGKENTAALERVDFQETQIRNFISRAKAKEWPVVQFNNGVVRPIYAQCPISELGTDKPYSFLGRTQIPLLAAWAITIHKSQGLSLDKVIVDLARSFGGSEMSYVALSRARNLSGLKVIRLPNDNERGRNREVNEFLEKNFRENPSSYMPVLPPVRPQASAPVVRVVRQRDASSTFPWSSLM